ncbi:MAG: glycosyltransferase family 4 protein [Acidimicrobiales bacterium]|nr:glycosyltransferase family 4 protein [Acidimicrobiales bacterium]
MSAASKKHVGVNLLWLVPEVVGGSEEYITRLLRAVAESPPEDIDITLFALTPFATAHHDLSGSFRTVLARSDGSNKAARVALESSWLGRHAVRHRLHLLHHTGGVIPPGPFVAKTPAALTIHDLQPLVMPENFSATKRRWLTTMIPHSAKRARVVMTPSDPASAQVVSRLGIDRAKVRTVPHGIEPHVLLEEELIGRTRSKYQLGSQVILYPAITYPHKDHMTLLRAFERLAKHRRSLTLVLTGSQGSAEGELAAAIRQSAVSDQVRRTGRIPAEDLQALYEIADIVAIPSRFEGFGNPALEAMSAGTPVVVADATALPWVVGDAGLKVPVGDVGRWEDALARILDQPRLARTLQAAGKIRASAFGWERAGEALVSSYRVALEMGETEDR